MHFKIQKNTFTFCPLLNQLKVQLLQIELKTFTLKINVISPNQMQTEDICMHQP